MAVWLLAELASSLTNFMASPFQRYQSGIQPVTGMLETGTNIGNAYLNAGSSIAENINKYYDTKAKNEQITGEGEQLATTLTGYYDVMSKDPEFQEYAESFIKPTLTSLQNLHDLNFNKRAGVVAGAKARYQDMATSLNLYQKMREGKLKRDINAGEDATKGKKASGSQPAVAVTRWNPYKTADQNYLDFKTQLDNARKAGFKGDDNEATYNWLDSVADDTLNGTFEGLSPEQSEQIRGGVQDQIYALRERLSDQLSGATPYSGDVTRSGMTAKDFLADRTVGAQTVVTDASGKPTSVTLPEPSSTKDINRGPIARFVNTKRGLVRVEVNQEYPSDMLPDEGIKGLDALKGYVKGGSASAATPSSPAPAPAPAALPAPEPAEPAPAKPAPAPAKPAPVFASEGDSIVFKGLANELGTTPEELLETVKSAGFPVEIYYRIMVAEAEKAGVTPKEYYKRIKDSAASTPAALPAPESAKPAPAPAPEALPAPASAPAATAPAKTEATTTNKDVSIDAYARSLGVPYEQFEKSVAESGLPSYQYYKDLKKGAEEAGISVESYYKGINAPAEEALPPPPSNTPVAEEKAPEGLPPPEEKPVIVPNSPQAIEREANRLIELGASPHRDNTIRYTIQKGDTPARIAKRFGISQKVIMDNLKAEGKKWEDVKPDTTILLMTTPEEGSADYSDEEYPVAQITKEEAEGKLPPSDEKTKTIQFSKDGKVIRPTTGDAIKTAETRFAQLSHGRTLTKAEREIEATKKSIVGLTRYVDFLAKNESYLGASTNWYGGFTTNEDFYVPEFDQEFMDIDDTMGGTTNVKGGFAVTSNPLKETEAWKSSWQTLYDIHDKNSYSRYQGGRVGQAVFGDFWSADKKIEATELIKAQIAKLEANLPTLVQERAKLGSRTPTYAEVLAAKKGDPASPVSALPETAPLMGEINTTVGTKEVSTDYTAEEKKDRLKAFLMERYKDSEGRSYIPAGFDSIYNALHPESNLRIIDTAIGPMYWDGNSYKQATNTNKQMTNKDIREAQRGVFGTQTEKGWIPQEVGEGTGVYLAGLFNRSDADLAKFDEMATSNASGLQALRGIKEILKIPLHAFPTDKKRQEAYGKVQVYIAALKAAIRTDIVGVGTVSNFEQTMINLAVPNPSELWRLDNADWGRIEELEKRLKNQLINTGAMKGVTVMFQEPEAEKDVESALRKGNKNLK